LFDVLLAAAPPLVVLILMVGFRWGGSKAGIAGWLVALVIAILRFGAGLEVLAWAHVRSLVLAVDVVYIVWAALLLYMVVDLAGALQVISDWFAGLTGDDVLRVLLLGWVFASFLQGVGGFGVPVAIVAPLLVGLGLSPLTAVVVPSIGHAWAVTFGSLGSSFIALLGVTGIDASIAAPPAAILLGVSAVACGILAALVYGGRAGLRRALPAIVLIGTVMAVGQYLLATNDLWNIAAAGGSLAGLAVGLWVARWPMYRRAAVTPENVPVAEATATDANPVSGRPVPAFSVAIAGYAVLVVLAVLITGVAPVKAFIGQFKLAVHVPEVATSLGWVTAETPDLGIKVFGHTGAVLVYSALIAYWLYRRRGLYQAGVERAILKGVRQKGTKAALGILSMVAMATIMSNAGMTRMLAEWLSQAVPPDLYTIVATAIGALGSFMTGSNTNSNAVFGTLQMDTALLLGLSVPLVLGAQTAAAAIASLLAPAKIIVGASTVGMSGDEGTVLRNLLVYGGILLLLIAALAFVFARLGY
jgi:lactate permease